MTHHSVTFEDFNEPGSLFRVAHRQNSHGLWYDAHGRETGVIFSLTDGLAAPLPMGPHPIFRDSGEHWVRVARSLPALRNWFSYADMCELIQRGYAVFRVDVSSFRRLDFPIYSDAVYCPRQVISISETDAAELYMDVAG